MELNHPGRCKHFFDSIEKQIAENEMCTTCRGSVAGDMFGCKPSNDLPGQHPDLLISGSPCDPFSTQRSKRWQSGNVKNHVDYDVTFSSVIKLYVKWEPAKGVLEQVHGFTLPIEAGSAITPKTRPGLRMTFSIFGNNCLGTVQIPMMMFFYEVHAAHQRCPRSLWNATINYLKATIDNFFSFMK